MHGKCTTAAVNMVNAFNAAFHVFRSRNTFVTMQFSWSFRVLKDDVQDKEASNSDSFLPPPLLCSSSGRRRPRRPARLLTGPGSPCCPA